MSPEVVGKGLLIVGIVAVVAGLVFVVAGRSGAMRLLPGDMVIQKRNFTLVLPIASSILASLVLSLIFWFVSR